MFAIHNFCFVDINDDEGKDKYDKDNNKADDDDDDDNDNDDEADDNDDDADDENDDIDEADTDSNDIDVLSCPDDGGEDGMPATVIVMMQFAWRWD